jgi:hypothetical protein
VLIWDYRWSEMQKLNDLNYKSKKIGLHINPAKTKMRINNKSNNTITLEHETIRMMEVVCTSETSVDNHFTWQYIPEDNSEHHTRRGENLKSHTIRKVADYT